MLQIGITGGIGSGKSIVCEVFKSLGVPVYHSDERAKFFINSDTQIICKIKNCFGNNIYWQDNKIDRHALAKIVFNNKESLELLNSIIHPIVNEDYQSWINKQNQAKYILKEAAIIFESDTYKNLNYIICVSAPEKLRIERVKKRDNSSQKEIEKRILNQISDKERKKRSDFILNNDGTELLLPQILKLHNKFNK